ncbi:MAG TPA: hypothetical protein PLR18_01160 [bacterium]|nr:hypothetical protein [bacterium]
MSEKRGVARSELGPNQAMGSLVEGEKTVFLKRMRRGGRELIILLTTLFVLSGSAEAKKTSDHEELKGMLPKFSEADLGGKSPVEAAERIFYLGEQMALALKTFGGETAWAEHNLEINGSTVNTQQIADNMPPGGPVFVFGSRKLKGGRSSLRQAMENPSQSYESANAVVGIGPGNKFVPSGEKMVVMGYGKDQEHALANALTFAAQDYRHNLLSGKGKGGLPASLGDISNLDFAAFFQLSNIKFQEIEGGSYRVVAEITPGSVEVVNEPNE